MRWPNITWILSQSGKDPQKEDIFGVIRLFFAAANGDIAQIDLLVKHGANPHHVDANGWDALFHAVNACQPNAVRHLIVVYGLNPNARDKLGRTPIMIAAARGDISTIETLIRCGADPYETDPDGWDILMYASGYGHSHAVTHFIVRYGMDPNRSDRHGLTPAIIASAKGHRPVIDILFKNGADMASADCQSRTALHHALIISDPIQSKTKFLPTVDNSSSFIFSLLWNYSPPEIKVEAIIDIIRRLISTYKLDPNHPDLYGNTPLMYAVELNDIIRSRVTNYNPLHYAVMGYTPPRSDLIIKTLIDLGANPFIPNRKGENAFMLAKKFGFELNMNTSVVSKIQL